MAKVLGKNADFGIGTTATQNDPPFVSADITRIETISNEIALNVETTSVDSTAYGDDFLQSEVLTYRWTVDITAYLQTDAAPNTESIFMSNLLGLAKYAFCFWPNGKPTAAEASATQPRYSGRVIVASVSVSPPRANIVTLRARLQGDGQLHRAVA